MGPQRRANNIRGAGARDVAPPRSGRACSLPPARTGRAILLHTRSAQAGKAVALERTFPRHELFLRQLVVTAGFLDRYAAAANRGYDRSLATDHPSFGAARRQAFHEPRSFGW